MRTNSMNLAMFCLSACLTLGGGSLFAAEHAAGGASLREIKGSGTVRMDEELEPELLAKGATWEDLDQEERMEYVFRRIVWIRKYDSIARNYGGSAADNPRGRGMLEDIARAVEAYENSYGLEETGKLLTAIGGRSTFPGSCCNERFIRVVAEDGDLRDMIKKHFGYDGTPENIRKHIRQN